MSQSVPPCPHTANVPLSSIGFYAIGGPATWVATPGNPHELASLFDWCRREGHQAIVTGKGSNMLFSDDGFPGVVISIAAMSRMWRVSDSSFFCEAGVENSAVAMRLMEAGRSGGEWLYRLPGMIGATVRMNGRCYGREASEVTAGAVSITLDGTVRWRSNEELFLGYKQTSLMQGTEVVAGVLLDLPLTAPAGEIRAAMEGYGRDREAKHQFDHPSCGSTFKNSYAAGRPSGQIFESLGFKGRREGGALVSPHHANFIFNTGGARAIDVLRLAARMRTEAMEKAGAELELELQCAGLFEAELLDACGVPAVPEPSRPGYAWAGLLQFRAPESAACPRTLLQGPLLDYSGTGERFPYGLTVSVEQLAPLDDAMQHPEHPFLRWSTSGALESSFPVNPPTPAGTFTDRLWESSVSELFIGNDDGYLEFEMTPEMQWVALRFEAPRKRSAGHETPVVSLWNEDVRRFSGPDGFGMELSYRLVGPFIRNGILSLQCCSSLGEGRYGLFPWWNDAGTPDFHQPGRYCGVRLI
jgi:UDP-N-acetylmuramate dehydrogenase